MIEKQIKVFHAIGVKNRVLWKNPDVLAPFNINLGQDSNIGVFLADPKLSRGIKPQLYLEVDPESHRSASLSIIFGDTSGNIYRDVDFKGIGYIARARGSGKTHIFSPKPRGEEDTWGIWCQSKAIRERDVTEELINRGIRIPRMVTIISLEEIALPNGKIVAANEARQRGYLRPYDIPVIGVRAFRVKDRIRHDVLNDPYVFYSAKEAIERELNCNLDWEEYLNWFATTLGNSLRRIHESHWHGWVSPHNVTLAAEIVDFGFGKGNKRLGELSLSTARQYMQSDFTVARDTLNILFLRLVELNLVVPSRERIIATFESFESEYIKTETKH